MISFTKKFATALEDKMRKDFALTQPNKSQHASTKYQKSLQRGM